MNRLYLLASIFILSACFGREEPEILISTPPLPVHYEVRAGQWTSCWFSCGKKDTLLAVTETACICRDGKRFLHAFPASDSGDPERSVFDKPAEPRPVKPSKKVEVIPPPAPDVKEPSKSIFDMLKSAD